jgi:hypothetical protein
MIRFGAGKIGAEGEPSEAPVVVSGLIAATDEDMAVIRAVTGADLTPDQVYILEPVVTTDALDAYFTRMAESSILNYVEDASLGNPLMTGHDTGRLAIGRSFAGRLEETDGVLSVRLRDYMLKSYRVDGNSTDDIARGIEAGVNRDMSISFGGPDHWYRCGVCGLNLFDENCPHCPGVLYGEERAFAWVEDAHMIEHSIVFSGATPGAVVRKARSLAATGMLTRADIGFLEDTWRVRIAGRGLFGFSKKPVREPDHDGSAQDLRLGREARSLGIESLAQLRDMSERARLGDCYREELVESALAEGIRARGSAFNKALWERMFRDSGLGIDDIKGFCAQFKAEARERFGQGGRKTIPPGLASANLPGQRFDDLPKTEQDRQIRAFLERTKQG